MFFIIAACVLVFAAVAGIIYYATNYLKTEVNPKTEKKLVDTKAEKVIEKIENEERRKNTAKFLVSSVHIVTIETEMSNIVMHDDDKESVMNYLKSNNMVNK